MSRRPCRLHLQSLAWLTLGASTALLAGAEAAEKKSAHPGLEVSFRAERAGPVFINIHRADGTLVRRMVQGQRFAAGAQKVVWDGRADDGSAVEPGEYTWRGLAHEGIALKLRGWAANGGTTPWVTPDGKGSWGGDAGVPSAVATDAERVYLGWSLAEQGKAILACDLDGRILWSHRRAEGASGCKALAVDDGLLYVLGGLAGTDAEGGAIYRLRVKDGQPVPWPNGQLDLKILSFWPSDSEAKPDRADAMAVRHDHIYLTFTRSEFLSVIHGKTGAYLDTVVGPPPGAIDIAPTKTDLPNEPGKVIDADFGVVALGGGVLGRVLFAHDPLWVITSELSPVERNVHISALTVIGDGAKFHRHTAFVGFGAPLHQIQARPLLDMESFTWVAGKAEGRPPIGPWQAESLRAIRGVALDAAGRLWVAESDAFPKRFSVWDTTGQQGKLVREFFGPPDYFATGGAINPLDPDLMVAQNCEWRIDPKTGRTQCLGVVTRENIGCARFGVGENGHVYLVTSEDPFGNHPIRIFERVGDGDYKLRTRIYGVAENGEETSNFDFALTRRTVFWSDKNGDGQEQENERLETSHAISFAIPWTMQDVTLHGSVLADGYDVLLKVTGWTECDAPRYDFEKAAWLPRYALPVTPDGRFYLTPFGGTWPNIICVNSSTGQKMWEINSSEDEGGFVPFIGGTARLPAPVNNIWVLQSLNGSWRMVNEDGFELARFFTGSPMKPRWPKSAVPGADMTNADSQGAYSGSVTHAVDGKLYIQTGRRGYWNLEVAGLDKVRALAGGKLVVPAAK